MLKISTAFLFCLKNKLHKHNILINIVMKVLFYAKKSQKQGKKTN